MSAASTYLAQAIIGHVLRSQAYTPPAGIYLALAVDSLTDDNDTTKELSASWYARKQIASWAAPTGSGMSTSNSNAVTFDRVTGSAVTVPNWGLYDAASGGNLIAHGAFDAAKVANVNNVLRVGANELVITFGGMFSVHLAQALINLIFRSVAYTPPSPRLALYTADPTASDVTANEVSAAWYARQAISAWTAPTGTGNSSANSAAFAFPAVTGVANVPVTHWGLKDAATLGNLLFSKALPTTETLNPADIFAGDPGDLVVQIL
jgi:hypothetical protein